MSKNHDNRQNGDSLSDHFLIAMPSLNDGFFNQTVTYICEHDANGSFGIIINQPTDIKLQHIVREMQLEGCEDCQHTQPVFLGGPVEQGRGFILHRPVGNWQSSLRVNDDIALTTSRDILQAIACNRGPADSIVALGYAGWAAGQLEDEMAANAWLSCPADQSILFDTPVAERWQAAARLIGIDLSLLSSDAGHA